jgi:hypothetical protein
MKKAIIDQIMLGFFLFAALIVFGATVSDEFLARKKTDNLRIIAKDITRALSKHYMYNEDIQAAQNIADDMLRSTKLGTEVLEKNLITYIWRDLDGDYSPDVVTTTITGYVQDNFWFRFADLDFFNLPPTDATAYVTKEQSEIVSITLRFGGSNAGYYNMVGTYELDENGCITNAKLLLANKTLYEIGDILGNYTDLNTRFFIIPDGYNKFGNRTTTVDSNISISGCQGNTPNVTIDGRTNSTITYFQDTYFNTDNGYDHMHEIGKTYFDDYENFISTDISYCSRYKSNGSCRTWSSRDSTWEDWVEYTDQNNIDFENDPNDEYIITMEDLPNGGDKDFNDINLDTTKIRIPKTIETSEVEYGNII